MAKKNTRVMFIKYHEAADQQPLSKKAAEKLGIFPSLPLGGLAAWVRQNGFGVKLIDLHVENVYPKDAADRVREYDPHIVALTAKTLGWPAVIEIAQMVKASCPDAVVVVGGPHLSIYAEESMTWECFDIAVIGDGEETFLEICERVESKSELTDVLGTVVRMSDGEIVRNAPRPLSRSINKYPQTAWDLIPIEDYNCLTLLRPFATMVTTRGCPWHCGYCSQVYSEKLRFRAVNLVVDEMEYLVKERGVREIVFFDETFTIGKKRMMKFSDEVQRRGIVFRGVVDQPAGHCDFRATEILLGDLFSE